jgi:hypothetical protein
MRADGNEKKKIAMAMKPESPHSPFKIGFASSRKSSRCNCEALAILCHVLTKLFSQFRARNGGTDADELVKAPQSLVQQITDEVKDEVGEKEQALDHLLGGQFTETTDADAEDAHKDIMCAQNIEASAGCLFAYLRFPSCTLNASL